MKNFKELREKCWDGWTKQGMKKKGNRMVPNCVKVSENFQDGRNPKIKAIWPDTVLRVSLLRN